MKTHSLKAIILTTIMVLLSTQLPARADSTTVHFNAWGGSPAINDYIQWVADEMQARHGITLRHVKLTDTATAVSRILAEKTAGRTTDGSVDLIWVNGENFASMKRNGLLQQNGWAFDLPNFGYTDAAELPGIITDFATPTDGLESPWGRAQLVFGHDTAELASPPRSAAALQAWVKANPGRFTFPQPPDFVGTTFLKQVLLEVAADAAVLQQPADEADTEAVLAPLWAWLDEVTPSLWRGGRHYPANYTEMVQLLGDREIMIAMAFNPAEFSNNIAAGVLPETTRSYIHAGGTISNVHFVAIPFNTGAADAAMKVADFLLSPEAQARKANPEIWGDPTVLSMRRLNAEARAMFTALPRGIATLSAAGLSPGLPEPHPSWIPLIEEGWIRRHGSGG
ncbi:MAG: ABC transporter substrate-binding protein [Candidatus Puniceispirillales bacterium]